MLAQSNHCGVETAKSPSMVKNVAGDERKASSAEGKSRSRSRGQSTRRTKGEHMDTGRMNASPFTRGRQILGKSESKAMQFQRARRSFLIGLAVAAAVFSSAHADSCKQLKKELEELVAKRKKSSLRIAKSEQENPGSVPFRELDEGEKKTKKYNQRIILISTKTKHCTPP